MDSKTQPESVGRRARSAAAGERRPFVLVQSDRSFADVEFGSGWYHEAAIKESEKAQVRPR